MKKKDGMAGNIKHRFILVICSIVVVMLFLIAYNGVVYYRNMSSALLSVGENSLAREKEQVYAYLQKSSSVLSVTAVNIDNMLEEGSSPQEVRKLLKLETDRLASDFDKNYTGIYAYINGTYVDGTDWVPGKDYVPTERDWYTAAVEAEGEAVISSPYVDAMTGKVIISISRLLDDRESVVSMDVTLDEVQNITREININDSGYGFVTDEAGLVIAHSDDTRIGRMLTENEQTQALLDEILSSEQGYLNTTLSGEKVVVFYENIMDNWYAVMVVSYEAMYQEVFRMIVSNTAVCVAAFLVILFFILYVFYKIVDSTRKEEESQKRADEMYLSIIKTLVQAIDAKDEYTNGHSMRVGAYSREIAKRMGKSEDEVRNIYYAALLHDVGKIRIPDEIINKKSRLSDEEYSVMKVHPVAGYYILRYVDNPLISLGAKEHHERYDGKGYPNGLTGDNISEIGRIIAVADAYDAMTSNRSYRGTMEQERVREQIEGGRGTQFDPEIADIMLDMIREDTQYSMRESKKQSWNILMVDDEPMEHIMMSNIMKDMPEYQLKRANSGNEALEFLKKEKVDLILLDIQMPGMDGYETYEQIKNDTSAPVVFLTGESVRESIEKAYAMGAADYLTKPFNAAYIREMLRNILREWEKGERNEEGIL